MMVYACRNKDIDVLKNSSSGGVFSLFAEVIINEGGNVIGASWDGLDVKHISIDKLEDINKLRKSKYVESTVDYSLIKEHTLFSGTPCQIPNNAYLKVDLVCHGTPTKESFLKYCEENGITSIDFKYKDNGYKIKTNKGIEEYSQNKYFQDFISNRNLCKKCYNCGMRGKSNADITLGDFWGLEIEHPEFYKKEGNSLVIIRTKKGEEYFNKIKEKLDYIESTYDKALKHNPCLEVVPVKR